MIPLQTLLPGHGGSHIFYLKGILEEILCSNSGNLPLKMKFYCYILCVGGNGLGGKGLKGIFCRKIGLI